VAFHISAVFVEVIYTVIFTRLFRFIGPDLLGNERLSFDESQVHFTPGPFGWFKSLMEPELTEGGGE
jgi:hypothetical protein